jgi:hypothetical protein
VIVVGKVRAESTSASSGSYGGRGREDRMVDKIISTFLALPLS